MAVRLATARLVRREDVEGANSVTVSADAGRLTFVGRFCVRRRPESFSVEGRALTPMAFRGC